jgi:hypothetical protein
LVASLSGSLPLAGSGVTLDNAPCCIVVNNVTQSGSAGNGITYGQLYYLYAVDSTHIQFHTSPQGAIDGTTDIVTITADFSANSYVKYLDPSVVVKFGCDIVPVGSSSSVDRLHGWRVIWRTAWGSSTSGFVQVTQSYTDGAGSASNNQLNPTVFNTGDMTLCYVNTSNIVITGGSDFNTATVNLFTGFNTLLSLV